MTLIYFHEHTTLGHNRTTMSNERLTTLSQAQRDRLAFIELRLRFVGDLQRQDLVKRFSVKTAAATRDMNLYR